jgi:hypothetical protein
VCHGLNTKYWHYQWPANISIDQTALWPIFEIVINDTHFEFGPASINNSYLDLAKIEIKQSSG